MGRRSLISTTTINKLFASYKRAKKQLHNDEIIKAQGGNSKETPPVYRLDKIDFSLSSRVAHIYIIESKYYRTIYKYITQNYVKYPIFSEWKIKEKIIKKNLKLTNSELESLNNNNDELIRMLSEEIIMKLNNENLFPSWFLKLYMKRELDSDLKNIENELEYFCRSEENNCKTCKNKITELKSINLVKDKQLQISISKKEKLKNKLQKISSSKHNVLFSILSFGIYSYFISKKRYKKIENKLCSEEENIDRLVAIISKNENKIKEYNDKIEKSALLVAKRKERSEEQKNQIIITYNKKISEIKPLKNDITHDDEFVDLKIFSGLEYKKIIGVYIFRNKENNKYYVGQSKDVMKRIKQHFNGTIPKNAIFAEDYYLSQIDNRDNLFELKIIECSTKDELDSLEKKLIFEYDSCNNGYNGTSGNY